MQEPEDNKKQNLNKSYANKCQKHVSIKNLARLLNQTLAIMLFMILLALCIMIKESKYCSDVMKKHFNKELVMTNEDNEDFENATKC